MDENDHEAIVRLGRVAIVARTKAQAESARRRLGVTPGNARCSGTEARPNGLHGYYPDNVVRVVGWDLGRHAEEADGHLSRMKYLIKRRRPVLDYSFDPDTSVLVESPDDDEDDREEGRVET